MESCKSTDDYSVKTQKDLQVILYGTYTSLPEFSVNDTNENTVNVFPKLKISKSRPKHFQEDNVIIRDNSSGDEVINEICKVPAGETSKIINLDYALPKLKHCKT